MSACLIGRGPGAIAPASGGAEAHTDPLSPREPALWPTVTALFTPTSDDSQRFGLRKQYFVRRATEASNGHMVIRHPLTGHGIPRHGRTAPTVARGIRRDCVTPLGGVCAAVSRARLARWRWTCFGTGAKAGRAGLSIGGLRLASTTGLIRGNRSWSFRHRR